MAAQCQAALDSEPGDRVGAAVIVVARRAAIDVLPFHVVLGHDESGLAQHQRDEGRVVGDLAAEIAVP